MTVANVQPAPAAIDAPASRSLRQRALPLLQTTGGRLAMIAIGIAILFGLKQPMWWQMGIARALPWVLPQHRKSFVPLGGGAGLSLAPPVDFDTLRALAPQHAATQFIKFWPAVAVGV